MAELFIFLAFIMPLCILIWIYEELIPMMIKFKNTTTHLRKREAVKRAIYDYIMRASKAPADHRQQVWRLAEMMVFEYDYKGLIPECYARLQRGTL